MLHDYPPVSGGGLALAVRDLVRLLDDRFDVTVHTSRLVDHWADDRDHPETVGAWPTWRSLARSDCVVIHWTFSFRWLSTVALVVAPSTRRHTVCVVHTAPDHCAYNRMRVLPAWLRRAAVRTAARLMARCDEVVALSPSHARALVEVGVPVTRVMPLPVVGQPSDAGVPHRPLRAPVVLGVAGELSVLKGSDDLPSLLAALVPEHSVVVAGRGPLSGALAAAVERLPPAARAAVTVTDRLPAEAMPLFLAGADCLLLCSRTESQCRIAIEAMLAGVIVLARRTTGVEDLVLDGRTGFLIDPGDPGTVHDRLALLLRDPDLAASIRAAARARAADVAGGAECGWVDLLLGPATCSPA